MKRTDLPSGQWWRFVSEVKHDPVFYREDTGKYYFFDETWTDSFGPFNSELLAREELRKYGEYLDQARPGDEPFDLFPGESDDA